MLPKNLMRPGNRVSANGSDRHVFRIDSMLFRVLCASRYLKYYQKIEETLDLVCFVGISCDGEYLEEFNKEKMLLSYSILLAVLSRKKI